MLWPKAHIAAAHRGGRFLWVTCVAAMMRRPTTGATASRRQSIGVRYRSKFFRAGHDRGATNGSTPLLFLEAALRSKGIDPLKDVKLVNNVAPPRGYFQRRLCV